MVTEIGVALDWWRWPKGAAIVNLPPASADQPPGPYIGDRLAAEGISVPMVPVRPFDPARGPLASGLFRTFADATRTDDGVAAFASDNGPLRTAQVVVVKPTGGTDLVETVADWQREGDQMRDAIALWTQVRTSGPPTGDGWVRLADSIRPHLWPPGKSPAAYADLVPAEDRPLAVTVVTTGLLEGLWFQLALAIDGDRDYRACRQCGQWFELDPSVARTSRLFCSDAHRSRAARSRLRLVERKD